MEKQKIIITKHAKKRLRQRHIENPNNVNLRIPKGKFLKKIKNQLSKTATKKNRNRIIFVSKIDSFIFSTYICVREKNGEYTLVTAINLKY